MERSELDELQYIAPIANIPSILTLGILSHNEADRVPHATVAMPEIQERRAKVTVPGGLPLHDYANLYFNARNPMMYTRRGEHGSLAVLRINPAVLDVPDVVISSGNASSEYTRFAAAPAGLEIVIRELVFAQSWWSSDEIDYYRRKSGICAEVLVPGRLGPEYVTSAYVSCQEAQEECKKQAQGLATVIRPGLFFQ